jgi:hypothetical protein
MNTMNLMLNPNYVLAPFDYLLGNCQSNVLMGLRIIENVDKFPEPTPEELRLFQLSFGIIGSNIKQSKKLFKKWILVNGFEDIHKCLRVTLERFFIYKKAENQEKYDDILSLEKFINEQQLKVKGYHFPTLLIEVNSLLQQPLMYQKQIESFNNARNCLIHTNGIVTPRHCNNIEKDKLNIIGNRFKLFFKKGDEETIAEIGKPGPVNAALMLGAEEFQIQFSKDEEIQLDLKQFTDILNTCIYIKADISLKLVNKHD